MTALDDLCAVPFHEADTAMRARILSRLANTELSVALLTEAAHDAAEMRIFDLPAGPVVLACDGEDRLAAFFGVPMAFAAMPGRVLARMLRAAGTGLMVNPGHPSEMLLDAETLGWLETALADAPEPSEADVSLTAPHPDVVAALAGPLADRLTDLRGLIGGAALAGIAEQGCHAVLIAGATTEEQPAIAKALAETLAFLPPQPGGVDIAFSDAPPPPGALIFDLTPPPVPQRPKGPPILR